MTFLTYHMKRSGAISSLFIHAGPLIYKHNNSINMTFPNMKNEEGNRIPFL
jgi:hypothetical protein